MMCRAPGVRRAGTRVPCERAKAAESKSDASLAADVKVDECEPHLEFWVFHYT
jgi:hypothetical protein